MSVHRCFQHARPATAEHCFARLQGGVRRLLSPVHARSTPFAAVVSNDFEIRVCVRHERPKVNEKKWPPQLCSLLTSCWAPEFRERPEFIDIVDAMMTLVAGESTPFSREVHGLHPMHA